MSQTLDCHSLCSLDPVLVVPAIFLIGLQGTPLEVIGGAVEKAEIIGRTTKAVELHNKEVNPQVAVKYHFVHYHFV